MSKVKCFVSYDYDHDLFIKEALIGQSKLDDSPFEIADWSIKQASPGWKAEARTRIRTADVVIVMCGKNTHTADGVSTELEIAQEEDRDYFLLGAYKDGWNKKPKTAQSSDKLYNWNWDNLKKLIHGNR